MSVFVATGADGYQFHRDHRRPRARPQDGAQISALAWKRAVVRLHDVAGVIAGAGLQSSCRADLM